MSVGAPVEDVAIEFGVLLSLLAREPVTPLGLRRQNDIPIKHDIAVARITPVPQQRKPASGIDGRDLTAIVRGLARAEEGNARAILSAIKLYHVALSLAPFDISSAYFSLVSAIECVSGHHLRDKKFDFDIEDKYAQIRKALAPVAKTAPEPEVAALKKAIVGDDRFVKAKFRQFIADFLPDSFWRPDDLYALEMLPKIEKTRLQEFLSAAYDARSDFTHSGTPFPAHVELGLADRVRVGTMMQTISLSTATKRIVPGFAWFERLTHCTLLAYLSRVVAPELDAKQDAQTGTRKTICDAIGRLSSEARDALKKLLEWTLRFKGLAIVGPMAPNGVLESSIGAMEELTSAGLISSADGSSWIKSRSVGEAVGEFFYGFDANPLRNSPLLIPDELL